MIPILQEAFEVHWARALDVAAHAIQAGKEAGTLPRSFCALELRHIQAERHWLACFRWP